MKSLHHIISERKLKIFNFYYLPNLPVFVDAETELEWNTQLTTWVTRQCNTE